MARATPGDKLRWRGTMMRPGLAGCLNTSWSPPWRPTQPSRSSRATTLFLLVSGCGMARSMMRKYMRTKSLGQYGMRNYSRNTNPRPTTVNCRHLRFAQPRRWAARSATSSRCCLCRSHHRDRHRTGNDMRWWAQFGIQPMSIAYKLWIQTHPIPTSANPAGPDIKARATAAEAIDKAPPRQSAVYRAQCNAFGRT